MEDFDEGTAAPAFFGFMGSSLALVLANAGAAYGTAKAGVGISAMGVMNPDAVMRNLLPVIMAGIIGIYGLILSVIISNNVLPPSGDGRSVYSFQQGFKHMASGLAVGLGGVGAGYAIGVVGDVGVKAVGLQPKLFVPFILILIMAEALALYGLIVSLVLSS